MATPEAFASNPQLVMDFYNERRRQSRAAQPNPAHLALAELETSCEVTVVTQNIDDLHERGGSTRVIHLHGSIFEARPVGNDSLVFPWPGDMSVDDRGPDGAGVRPNVVWFGEAVPEMGRAEEAALRADVILVIGTSLQVYPAAGLASVNRNAEVILIDPRPAIRGGGRVRVIAENASIGVPLAAKELAARA